MCRHELGRALRGWITAAVTLCACLSNANAGAQGDDPKWRTVALHREDGAGFAGILAILRNPIAFVQWLDGQPLNGHVSLSYTKKVDTRAREIGPLEGATSSTRYIVTESEVAQQGRNRYLILDERARRLNLPLADTVAQRKLMTLYEYPEIRSGNQLFHETNLSRPQRRMGTMSAGQDRCDSHDCAAGDASAALLRALSRDPTRLDALRPSYLRSLGLEVDTTSAKAIYFEHAGERVRNIRLVGFLRGIDEELVAPDATSAWVLTTTLSSPNTLRPMQLRKESTSVGGLRFIVP